MFAIACEKGYARLRGVLWCDTASIKISALPSSAFDAVSGFMCGLASTSARGWPHIGR